MGGGTVIEKIAISAELGLKLRIATFYQNSENVCQGNTNDKKDGNDHCDDRTSQNDNTTSDQETTHNSNEAQIKSHDDNRKPNKMKETISTQMRSKVILMLG